MAKRIMIDDAIREAAKGQPASQLSCPECGDLITDHAWVELDSDAVIVACDRERVSSAAAVSWLMRVRAVGVGQANREFADRPVSGDSQYAEW
jgi:hypothetical protein